MPLKFNRFEVAVLVFCGIAILYFVLSALLTKG